ncbi:MAG: tRNA uridine-5-carboxymethylaminomethyl(34) synthesis GTPase MnmE [Bacilli bacterium]
MEDTIAAVATTIGESSINVIRISGNDSINVANKIFSKDIRNVPSHTVHYGFIVENNEKIDEVFLSVFRTPKSFTTEDVVEISVHGGSASVNKVMELVLSNGARLAEPGEFLKRAFLNGRIDLTQAEAVGDLINAQTESSRKMALKGVDKTIFCEINELKEKVLALIANIEVNIDYPEYEDAVVVTKEMINDTNEFIRDKVNKLLKNSKKGLLIKNGLKIVIVGKPNVGKSSILNSLLKENKAIVTDIKGTTRDIVEGILMIDGVKLDILDTAGIRETDDVVEAIGVKRSVDAIEEADLVLFVIDSEDGFNHEDKEVLDKIKDKEILVVYNKNDKKENYKVGELSSYNSINISTFDNDMIEKLKDKISCIFDLKSIAESNYTYISNARQIALLNKSLSIVDEIENAVNNDLEVDMIEIDVKRLWETLGEITGEVGSEDLLNEIFSKFCLGK